jgi:outer membrane protein assembly factor BamB
MRTSLVLVLLAAFAATAQEEGRITFDRILKGAEGEPGNWLTYSGNYAGHRYSPLSQINETNVARLRPAWSYQVNSLQRFETTPIVDNGIMYISEPPSNVTALDIRTGRPLWRYRRVLGDGIRVCCGQVNRGVAVLGGLVYVGTVDAHLVALDVRTGAVRWERQVSGVPPALAKHLKNSYASETPVTDGERVYFYFANAGVFAFDLSGNPVWSRPMGPFKTRNNWGSGGSPALHGGRLYIVNDNDAQSFIVALDARTGAELWRVNRTEGTNWSTPFVWQHAQRTEIVTAGSDRVRSYDTSGRLLWELTGMSTISIPTPFERHGLLFLSSGYIGDALRPAYAIRPGAAGDISLKAGETSNAAIAWSAPTGAPYNPTPLVVGDLYYTLFDRGFFTAHEARTGKEVYPRQRITGDASGFTASPWAYNGKVFALSEDGDTYVIQGGTEFKVVGKNSLNEMTLATPAVARGSLFIRTASKLYRITKGS